jgi:ubiquinone/menaquinone biosynthesis C-methylase UbiE
MTEQKKTFLQSEGNAWFNRNKQALAETSLPDQDRILPDLLELPLQPSMKVLEIGCGSGNRLVWLKENLALECSGIDPSAQAIEVARSRGIDAYQGTADSLPFEKSSFDLVIFGFCLYLCDRTDLFQISQEADRVLKNQSWLVILDFFAPTPISRPYHHFSGISSYKMDCRTLFDWHPAYVCMTHKVRHHVENTYTDETQNWVSLSIFRKSSFELSI